MPSTFKTLAIALLMTSISAFVANNIARSDVLPDGTPEEQYSYAIGLTLQDGVEKALEEFILTNPLSQFAVDARYSLGRIQFLQKKFEKSFKTLRAFKRDYPDDSRVKEIDILLSAIKVQLNDSPVEPTALPHVSTVTPTVLPNGTPEDQFRFALSLALQNELETAERAMIEFLALHPEHKRFADATFWLGRILFIQEKFSEAKSVFLDFIKFEDDARLPEVFEWLNHTHVRSAQPRKVLYEPMKWAEETKSLKETQTSAPPLGMSEIDMVLNHISNCFVLPPNFSEELLGQVVDIDVEMRRDGSVEKITFVDNGQLTTDRNYRIVAMAARRAILDCQPLPLPEEKYDSWKLLPLGFNPSSMQR